MGRIFKKAPTDNFMHSHCVLDHLDTT